jgi:hypothetical protein
MFAALLAEVRAYGEGLIIVEQIPSKLVTDVIKNTVVKFVHRLPAEDDRKSVGATMNLDESQSRYVVSLEKQEGAVFTDGMDRPLLVRIPNGRAAERGELATPAPIADLIGRRSATCGVECRARACTLRQMTEARQLLARYPVLTIWAELTVLAHLRSYRNPTLDLGYRRLLRAEAEARVVQCAISHAVDDAVDVRSAQLQPELSPSTLAEHCCVALTESLFRDGEDHCDEERFVAKPLQWSVVASKLALRWADGERHPESAEWERRYHRLIPGDTAYEQGEAVRGWDTQATADKNITDAVTFGTQRPSALELAMGGTVTQDEEWSTKAETALIPFAEAEWSLTFLVPQTEPE